MSKTALITGASRGIGKAVAIHLASKGFEVGLAARNVENLKAVEAEIEINGGKATCYQLDVSSAAQVEATVDQFMKDHGQIDLLFNNAGVLIIGTTDVSNEEVDQLLNINLHGAIYMANAVAKYMKKQKSGYIVNLSSVAGKRTLAFSGLYAASKFGFVGFSDALFKEMSLYNVKVTTLCPSFVATDMTTAFDFSPEDMIQPEDICKSFDYLLSLSANAAPQDLLIECMPAVKQNAQKLSVSPREDLEKV